MLGRLPRVVKRAMRRAGRGMGLEVCRLQHSPAYTLCGLRNLDVRTVVDVGANTGQFARQALEWFPRAQIVSFEPVSEAFEELGRLAEESRGRVRAEQVALGEQEGTLADEGPPGPLPVVLFARRDAEGLGTLSVSEAPGREAGEGGPN